MVSFNPDFIRRSLDKAISWDESIRAFRQAAKNLIAQGKWLVFYCEQDGTVPSMVGAIAAVNHLVNPEGSPMSFGKRNPDGTAASVMSVPLEVLEIFAQHYHTPGITLKDWVQTCHQLESVPSLFLWCRANPQNTTEGTLATRFQLDLDGYYLGTLTDSDGFPIIMSRIFVEAPIPQTGDAGELTPVQKVTDEKRLKTLDALTNYWLEQRFRSRPHGYPVAE